MNRPLVVIDADVLGRQRTGDESYVENLLRELPALTDDIRFAAVVRDADVLPEGVEPIVLPATSQVLRMTVRLPRLLRRVGPSLAHFLHVVPPAYRGPAVLTVQDLSFEADRRLMSVRDRLMFSRVRPSARRAARILTGSERTRDDLVAHYGLPPEKVVLTPYGVDPAFGPEGPSPNSAPYAVFVGALHARKNPLAAVEALALVPRDDLRLVMIGPDKGLGAAVRDRAASLGLAARVDVRGHVAKSELAALYRGARCLVFPSRYEGFGLPIVEAMASGTPVVTTAAGATTEVAGGAAVIVEQGNPAALAGGIERAIADRERLVAAGLQRARDFTWADTARRTLAVYRELL